MWRTYDELTSLPTLKARYEYLKLGGEVGSATFGSFRAYNQEFYNSEAWRKLRNELIVRDDGCELALPGLVICDGSGRRRGIVYLHHLNPITIEDIIDRTPALTDPNNLVCCGYNVHAAIHYGREDLLPQEFPERRPGDTKLW